MTHSFDQLPKVNGKLQVRILRLGKMTYEDQTSAEWFDFVEVPQGYIHVCGTSVKKPKRVRKFPHTNGSLIDPTDEQIIDQAKDLLARNLDPNDFEFVITDKDFRKEKELTV